MPRHLSSWFLAALAVASLIYFVPAHAAADMISSSPVAAPVSSPAVQAPAASSSVVADTLRAQGLDEVEIAQRMSELHPADMVVLADSPQQVQLGAGTDFGLIAIILAVAILFAVILYLID